METKLEKYKKFVAVGWTLTGHDELEPGASTNAERIDAMCKLYSAGFKTFASIEPVIDCDSSVKMMWETQTFCDLYKVGLQSGKKYDKGELSDLMSDFNAKSYLSGNHFKIYYKDSFLKAAGVSRSELPDNCITKDYNIFNNK
jgi:DNA repair photolyase